MASKAELRAKLSLSTVAFDKGLKLAVKGAKIAGATIVASMAAAGVGLALLTKKAYDLGSELQDMVDKTGIAADQIMILQQAAKDNGIDDITGAIGKMQKNLVEATKNGLGPAAQALNVLGLKADDLINKDPVEQFQKIGEAIGKIENPALKAAEAMEIFGKSGRELLPLFADTGALDTASQSIGRQAELFKQHAEDFDKVSDRLGRAHLKLQGFGVGLASAILPSVLKITEKFDKLDLAAKGEKFAEALNPILEKLSKVDFSAAADTFVRRLSEAIPIVERMSQMFQAAGMFLYGSLQHPIDTAKGFAKGIFGPSVERADEGPMSDTTKYRGQAPPEVVAPWQAKNKTLSSTGLRAATLANNAGYFESQTTGFTKNGVNGGFGSSSSLTKGAYGQTNLLSIGERRAHQNAMLAAGLIDRDSRSNSMGRDVIRRGDRARAKNVAKEEQRKQMTLEGTNEWLSKIDQKLK